MLLGTETIAVILFNAGHSLEDVSLAICGLDSSHREVCSKNHELAELPRGREVTVEVPSYELDAPACDITVKLIGGRLASE